MSEEKWLITKEEAVSGVLPAGAGTFRVYIDGQTCGAKNFALLQNTMDAGFVGAMHEHETEHGMYVISGTGKLNIEGKAYPLVPGSAIFVPPCIQHQTVVDPGEDLNYIIIYAPTGPEQKLREKGAQAFIK